MKILWMSNVFLTLNASNTSGTWIHSMYQRLHDSGEVNIIANITLGNVSHIEEFVDGDLKQYVIPKKYTKHNGLPNQKAENSILKIIKLLSPDIIHVWGLELYWGIIAQHKDLKDYRVLIEIQGLKSIVSRSPYFFGGLSTNEIAQTRRLIEIRYPRSYIKNIQKAFYKWGAFEVQILQNARYINTQSEWVRSVVRNLAPQAMLYETNIILRDEFVNSPLWCDIHKRNDINLFTITSPLSYKGVHITIKSFAIVKQKYPKAQLRIAGITINPTIYRNSGYIIYLIKLIRRLNLQDSIIFLGNLDANGLLKEMYRADVCIISSFIESFCLALAESMIVGVPCVASYTSALPELINDSVSGQLYPMGDYFVCAEKIMHYLEDDQFTRLVSINASHSLRKRLNSDHSVKQQINTYKQIVAN